MKKLDLYEMPLEVRSYDADGWGELSDSMLLRLLEHLAWTASAAAGFDIPWYESHGVGWIVRRMIMARPQPIRFDARVRGRTWISSARRIRSHRDYQLLQADDGQLAVAAQAEWVFVDRHGPRPIAIAPALLERIGLHSPVGDLDPRPVVPCEGDARTFATRRRAARFEADSMGHVNNAVYASWLDEALDDAVAEAGLPLALPGQPGPRLVTTHLALDYLLSVRPGEQIEVCTRLAGRTADNAILAWDQELVRVPSGERILHASSQRRLLEADPDRLVSRLVK